MMNNVRLVRYTARAFAGAVVAALACTTSLAASLKLSTTDFSNGGGLGGGAYKAQYSGLDLSHYDAKALFGSGANLGFGTFCLEFSEHFNSGNTYDYTTASYASNGGFGGAVGNQDPLSVGTAWLYFQYATGNLAGFNYTGTSSQKKASSLELQLAIWYLESETGHPTLTNWANSNSYNFATNSYVALASSTLGGALWNNANGAYGVQVLNLTSVNNRQTVQNQSQLYFGGVPSVPDSGATLSLSALTLIGLGLLRRRRR